MPATDLDEDLTPFDIRPPHIPLTRAQCAALRRVLAPRRLTRRLQRDIEDGLSRYVRDTALVNVTSVAEDRAKDKRFRRVCGLVDELMIELQRDGAAFLLQMLQDWAQPLRDVLTNGGPPAHRPPDHTRWFLERNVVIALDRAQVPLTLGRRTPVVLALRLVRCWARGQPTPPNSQPVKTAEYLSARTMVQWWVAAKEKRDARQSGKSNVVA